MHTLYLIMYLCVVCARSLPAWVLAESKSGVLMDGIFFCAEKLQKSSPNLAHEEVVVVQNQNGGCPTPKKIEE